MSSRSSVQGRTAVLAGVLLSLVNGILYSWSVFILPVENATGLTRQQTSLVFTFILVFFGTGMMTGGYVLRRLGPRMTAMVGGAMLALGLAGAAMASTQWQLILAYGMTAGYGIGMANIVPSAVGLRWFPDRRGLICGIMAFSLAFGTLIFGTGLAGRLIPLLGVSRTLFTMSALVLMCSILAGTFLTYPADGTGDAASDSDTWGITTVDMLKTSGFRLVWTWAFAIQAGGLMIIGHIVPYAVEQGCLPAGAELAMGVYAVVNGTGRLFFGQLFDLKGARFAMVTDSLCLAAGLLLLLYLPKQAGYPGLLTSVVVIALASGGTIPLFSAFIARNFGPAHLETNIGMTASVFIAAGFAGPYAGGLLQTMTGNYAASVLTAAALGIPGILAALHLPRKA